MRTFAVILIFFILSVHVTSLSAQFKPVTEKDFSELFSEIDYTDKTKRGVRLKKPKQKEKKKTNKRPFNLELLQAGANILNLLAYILIILLIGVILYFLFKNLNTSDKSIVYAEEPQSEEDIEDIDAQEAYKIALENGDYRTAIRMRFILILQDFSSRKSIQWMPEKTNRDYLRELRGTDEYQFFQKTSAIYDKVWYGHVDITKEEFDLLNPQFDSLKVEL